MSGKIAAALSAAGLVIGAPIFALLLLEVRFGVRTCEELIGMDGEEHA
jgi:hypothetical protein